VVFIKFFNLAVISDAPFEPESPSDVELASVVPYSLGLDDSGLIEFFEMRTPNSEEDVIVYPLGNGSKALGPHDVGTGICYSAIYTCT
jgi:hypothetical protein